MTDTVATAEATQFTAPLKGKQLYIPGLHSPKLTWLGIVAFVVVALMGPTTTPLFVATDELPTSVPASSIEQVRVAVVGLIMVSHRVIRAASWVEVVLILLVEFVTPELTTSTFHPYDPNGVTFGTKEKANKPPRTPRKTTDTMARYSFLFIICLLFLPTF